MRTTQANNAKQSSLALEEKELALPTQDGRCQRHTTKQQMEPWKKRSWRCQLKNGVANATQEYLARHQVLVSTKFQTPTCRANQVPNAYLPCQPSSKRPNAAPLMLPTLDGRCQRQLTKTRQPEHVHFNGRYLELQRSKLSTSSCVGKLTFRAFQPYIIVHGGAQDWSQTRVIFRP